MLDSAGKDDVDIRDLLIRILSEWMIKNPPPELTKPNARYSVPDFFAVTDLLGNLKGVKGEAFTLGKKDIGKDRP